ncbi:MAG: divergent polysaccharide deacetylase family protein [Candidatus Dadabacteria bacterium]|nr:divergent polysaccharide deacetylase family protein [Candidatus Dadabacteria bacterium]
MEKRRIGFRRRKAGGKRQKKDGRNIYIAIFAFTILVALSVGALLYINKKTHSEAYTKKSVSTPKRSNSSRVKPDKSEKKAGKEKEPAKPVKLAKLPEEKPAIVKPDKMIFEKQKPKLVIIVDDLGLNREPIDKLIKIPAQLSFAVLPHLPYSRYAAEAASNNGLDVILHLPMEPTDSSGYAAVDAGEDVLFMGLPKDKILDKLEKNLASIPYIKGVNNHMGSKFTESNELMELILQRIKSKGLFFIDSKTSRAAIGYQVAKKLGMKAAVRDLFLDEDSQEISYIRSQLEKLISISKEKGYAIGICHPYSNTVKVLSQDIPEIKQEIEIIPASRVVN